MKNLIRCYLKLFQFFRLNKENYYWNFFWDCSIFPGLTKEPSLCHKNWKFIFVLWKVSVVFWKYWLVFKLFFVRWRARTFLSRSLIWLSPRVCCPLLNGGGVNLGGKRRFFILKTFCQTCLKYTIIWRVSDPLDLIRGNHRWLFWIPYELLISVEQRLVSVLLLS